jgi:4-amino-4-deoxy-L-arabinose transferase-like glycosyltransferase
MASRDEARGSRFGRWVVLLAGRPWLAPLALAALCGLLYFWRLGAAPLRDFDEAYYAGGAREMLARGDLLTPYFNGQPFLQKPVLIYWITAAAFRTLGLSEFAARVGPALLGALVVLATYYFGVATLGRRAGLFAGLALALNYMWLSISRNAYIDAPLVAALAPALFLLFLASRSPARTKRRLTLASSLLLGIALLAKGPVPVGVVLVGLLAYLVAARALGRTLREAPLLAGVTAVAVMAVPWYAYELAAQPAFFRVFFIGEHIGHIRGELARSSPIWTNLSYLVMYFAPWMAFLPAALGYAFRQPDRTHVLRFAAWWAVAVVVLFSLPSAKLAHYLAPAFPPLALLVGAWLDAWLSGKPAGRASVAAAFVLLGAIGALCLGVAAYAAVSPPSLHHLLAAKFGRWTPGASAVVIPAALGAGFVGAVVAARWRRALVVPALGAAMLVAGITYGRWFEPRRALIEAQPRKELAQRAAALLPDSEPLGVYYAKRNSTIFYLGRPIVDLGEWEPRQLTEFLSSPRLAAAITHQKFVADVSRATGRVHVLGRRGDYVLIANHPPGGGRHEDGAGTVPPSAARRRDERPAARSGGTVP